MQLGQSGALSAARALLDELLATCPSHSDALQLQGMIARRCGDNDEAVRWFQRSLRANPAQPHVLGNLGNALLDLGEIDAAIRAYRDAVKMAPGNHDATAHLGMALTVRGDTREACDVLEAAVRSAPRHAKMWAVLGSALRAENRLAEAVIAFRNALALRPGHVATMHNLGVALRLSGQPGEAAALLRTCAVADPASPEIHYNLGHCLQDLGDVAGAAEAYRRTIALRPLDRDAHASLARLCWQAGDSAAHLNSYREVLGRHPDDAGLLADFAHQLNLRSEQSAAAAVLGSAFARGVDGAELRLRMGQAFWGQGNADAALAEWAAGRRMAPDDASLRREMARALIILARYEEALSELGADEGADQQSLAYHGLCWRFLRDPRADWLNNYDRFVHAAPLTPPDGADIVSFNTRLAARLADLHAATRHPLDQTLRGGTQTTDDLFGRDIPEVRAVQAMIEAEIARYIATLPDDPDHPFLRRKSRRFAFSGSWSVRLRRGGHHVNHVHPEGWISSCYYVALPKAVDGSGHQGWLKFGESALNLGPRESVARMEQPEVGKLVLFPSYFYHGTVPFDEAADRLTIAFDVIPAA